MKIFVITLVTLLVLTAGFVVATTLFTDKSAETTITASSEICGETFTADSSCGNPSCGIEKTETCGYGRS